MLRLSAAFVAALVCASALAAEPVQRTLTFEERVRAQTAIERVYYSHQVGTTKPFEEAVPKAVVEAKVRKYLQQTAALSLYWKTAVTDESLQREMERMATGTRMPERLRELYAALGGDAFLVKECLARATLVDRLCRGFYAFDPTMHLSAKTQANELLRKLNLGELDPKSASPFRTVSEWIVGEAKDQVALKPEQITAKEFKRRRGALPAIAGEVSAVNETPEGFEIRVILTERATRLRVATFGVRKVSWDDWWRAAQRTLSIGVSAEASAESQLSFPGRGSAAGVASGSPPDGGQPCAPSEGWDNGSLDDLPDPRASHSAVWTGSQMLVWGGTLGNVDPFRTGGRYDPVLDTWTPMTTLGAPAGRFLHVAAWTGTEMVVWGGGHLDPVAREVVGLDTGGRYDLASDTWRAMTQVNAPTPRIFATAVWTGQSMLVWAGQPRESLPAVNTGGRYDPATDTWTSLSSADAPPGRIHHVAAWAGNVMIVWGGERNGSAVNDGGRYDAGLDQWLPTSTVQAPSARARHSAVSTGSSMMSPGDC